MSRNDKNKLRYKFAPTGGGEEVGFNDPATTTFKGHIAYHLARESLQNIIDAKVDDNDDPVRAEFSLHKVNAEELPKHEDLERIFRSCSDYFSHNEKCRDFFGKAAQKIEKNKSVPILKISDYNTEGLTGGTNDRQGNYYGFMKSVGASDKSAGSGGSFGLGKGSYFAASSFRTMFVSSVYDGDESVFQGKLRLVTHLDENGETVQNSGSFGLVEDGEQKPVRDKEMMPDLFKRDEFDRTKQGTDMFIVDFSHPDNWKEYIIESVLTNFWLAIHWNLLEVQVGDTEINSSTLEGLLEKYFDEEDSDTSENPNPLPFFKAYTDKSAPDVRTFEEELSTLGNVELYLKVKDVYPGKVAYARNTGMVIQKKSHRCIKSYAGVFICRDKDESEEESMTGNEILRQMENPTHDEWDPHNVEGDEKQKIAKRARREMYEFVRNALKSLVGGGDAQKLQIPGLENYLYLPDDQEFDMPEADFGSEPSGDTSKEETGLEKTTEEGEDNLPINETKRVSVTKSRSGAPSGEGEDITSEGVGGSGEKEGTGSGGSGGKDLKELDEIDYRSFAIEQEGNIYHVIKLDGPPGVECNLGISVGTENDFGQVKLNEAVNMEEGSEYEVGGRYVKGVVLNPEGNATVRVAFDSSAKYALKVSIYEN